MLNKFIKISIFLILVYILSYVLYDKYISSKNGNISNKNEPGQTAVKNNLK